MIWLLLAIGLSALFAWIATWLSRRPQSLNYGIRQFSRGLEALAPPDDRGGHVRPLHTDDPDTEPPTGSDELDGEPPLAGEGG